MINNASNFGPHEHTPCLKFNIGFQWKQTKPFMEVDPSDFLYEGDLIENVNGSNFAAKRHYILTKKSFISCFISPNNKDPLFSLKKRFPDNYVILLENPELKGIKYGDKYGFTLIIGNDDHKFLCDTKIEARKWMSHLIKVGIMKDINKHYKMGAIIGLGGSATVRFAVNNDNKREYAVKSLMKSKLLKSKQAMVLLLSIIRKIL